MDPLTPAVFHVMVALADSEKHGYAIMQEVAAETNNQIVMGPGTLYGTLKRMLEARLICECESRCDPQLDNQRRRFYRLTPQGKKAATAELERLQSLVRAARSKSLFNRPQKA